MPARLTVFTPDLPARIWSLQEGSAYLVGRDAPPGTEADIPIVDDRVSRRHAMLTAPASVGAPEAWRIRDEGSKNGVEIEGRAVDEAALGNDCWVSFGGVVAHFERLREDPTATERGALWRSSAAHGRRLEPSLGVGPLLERLLDSLLELSRTERGYVLVARGPEGEPDVDSLEVAATRGDVPSSGRTADFPGSLGVVDRVLATGRPTACADAAAETWLGARASVLAGGLRTLVCLPLRVDERNLGVVYADSRRPGAAITDVDLEILAALADHASLALQLALVDREIRGLARTLGTGTDPDVTRRLRRLTGGAGGPR